MAGTLSGSFTCRKYATWDKLLYFPSEGRRAEDFLALKNPTASAGFEPALVAHDKLGQLPLLTVYVVPV